MAAARSGAHFREGMVGQMMFTVRVSREDRWWVAEVDGVLGGATEVSQLSQLDVEVRDLLSGLLDIDEAELQLKWDFSVVLGKEGQATWEAFEAERMELIASSEPWPGAEMH